MTRKDFELIARVVSNITNTTSRRGVAEAFASELSATNPRFNRARFLDACGVLSERLPLMREIADAMPGDRLPTHRLVCE